MIKPLRFLVTGMLLSFVLAACTITTSIEGNLQGRVRFDTPVRSEQVITEFRPTRGTGSLYEIGDEISFVLRTTRPGYVTLSYLDSAGRTATFARNIPVGTGRTVLSGPDARHWFQVAPPRGIMQIRATFTANRTNESVSLIGRGGTSGWNSLLVIDLRGQPVYDAVQTYIEVR